MLLLTIKTRTRVLSNFVKILGRWDGRENERRLPGKCLSDDASIAATPFNFGAGYTDEEKNLILRTINDCTMDELKKYGIAEARIKKLIAYRDKNKFFDTLDSLLLLQGIEIGVLDKFCKSIVKKEGVAKLRAKGAKGESLTPPLNDDTRNAIDTCTGIWICGNIISWARLDTNCNLLQWDCHSLDDVAMRNGVVAVVDSVTRVVSKVPPSDAYIMESDPIIPLSRMNTAAYHLQLQRQQILATIASILGTRAEHSVDDNPSETMINNVYMMRHRTAARLFNLLIGTEIVSAKKIVGIMMNVERRFDEDQITVSTDPDIKEYYKSRDIFEREQMNWSLLLTLAFVHLAIKRTANLKKSIVKYPGTKKS